MNVSVQQTQELSDVKLKEPEKEEKRPEDEDEEQSSLNC